MPNGPGELAQGSGGLLLLLYARRRAKALSRFQANTDRLEETIIFVLTLEPMVARVCPLRTWITFSSFEEPRVVVSSVTEPVPGMD